MMPYTIENNDTGERVRRFGSLPKSFDLPDGRRVIAPVAVGDEGLGHRFIQIDEVDFQRPGTYFTQGADTESRVGSIVTITRSWVAWTQTEIDAYEAARLDDIAAQLAGVDDLTRAAMLVILDEFNRHSVVHRAILKAAADATNLASFKTAMAAITSIPERTPLELLSAARAKLGLTT